MISKCPFSLSCNKHNEVVYNFVYIMYTNTNDHGTEKLHNEKMTYFYDRVSPASYTYDRVSEHQTYYDIFLCDSTK